MGKIITYSDTKFKQTEKILLSTNTQVIESVIGHKTLDIHFDNGMRSLEDYLIYFITKGQVNAWISGQKTCLKAGMIIWLSPKTVHHFWCDPKNKEHAQLYHFRFRLQNPKITEEETGFLIRQQMQDSEELVTMYYNEAQSAKRDKNQRLRNILYLILSDCKNIGQQSIRQENRLNSAAYKTILNYTKAKIKNWPSPADLAAEINYSSDYFSRIFRKSFYITPQRWLVQQRIRAIAEEMENSHLSISEIAFEYGYNDIYFFSRQFKQVIGISPRKWRRQS